jgi:predicted small lipoprotein YifL
MKSIFKLFAAALITTVSMTGCGKKAEEAPAETKAPVAPVSVAGDAPAAPPPPTTAEAAPEAGEAMTQASNLSPMDYSNASGLTLMVQEFHGKHGRVPKDLNELVAAKMLLKAPTPPPGTKYVIDPNKKQVLIIRAQ